MIMNAITSQFSGAPLGFQSAYGSLDAMERRFVDGYVTDLQIFAEKTGQQLGAVIHLPFPYELDQRSIVMLAGPMVRAAITERVQSLSQAFDFSIARTLRSLSNVAYSNIQNYFEIDILSGHPSFALHKATKDQLEAVKSIEIEDLARGGRKFKITLHDKMNALNLAMRYQGLLHDESDHWRKTEQAAESPDAKQLPADTTDQKAADLYSRMINGK